MFSWLIVDELSWVLSGHSTPVLRLYTFYVSPVVVLVAGGGALKAPLTASIACCRFLIEFAKLAVDFDIINSLLTVVNNL